MDVDRIKKIIVTKSNGLPNQKELIFKSAQIIEKVQLLREFQMIYISPRIFVASILYVSSKLCGERIPQEQVAEICGTTSVSLRKMVKRISDSLEDDPILIMRPKHEN